ncbi:MAG: plasma-membrane proton-efflux P-type ATPase [Actinomycetota bacterium]|nr:plasma-membrane proton-efflux P-type ATPase [Actinomycetota bacterium]
MTQSSSTTSDPSALPLNQLAASLGSGPDGLSSEEAARRLASNGPNAIQETKKHPLLMFLSYFWAPIPWLIEVALVLSLILQHWPDAIIIAVLLLMNGFVGFYEEHQASDTIAALKKSLATTAHVRRDRDWVDVPVAGLVTGDLIHVALGDIVPADARILDDGKVSVDQSALTGESLPVSRSTGDQVYSGSVLARGQANAMVYATGDNSFFGKTTALVQSAGTVSHFQKAVLRIGTILIYAALILIAVTTASSLLHGDSWVDAVDFGLVVVIASVPVAMPAVLSVTMAVGARKLATQKAVVSHLPAVEELGGIDVLCSDKTGTLTQNRVQVGDPWAAPGVTEQELIRAAVLASSPDSKDAIDLAVRAWLTDQHLIQGYTLTAFTAFDPTTKRTQADTTRPDGGSHFYTKGAPQVIRTLCTHENPDTVSDYQDTIAGFAKRGDRALGVAESQDGNNWRLLGVLPLADPPRGDSASTIADAIQLGVQVKMVTGDALAIGKQIASQVGIGSNLIDANELETANTATTTTPAPKGRHIPPAAGNPSAVADLVEHADGFAQVFPEHKYLIVKALQSRGHIVGMTGDGVNDAPALKQADAGIAVSGATDAARASADFVLLAPGLSVIVRAIRLAREMFARMTSYTTYRIAETIRVLLLVTISVVALNFRPVTAIMIVILALLNDGALLFIAYDHAHGSRKPVKWDMRQVLTIATSLGVMGVIETFGLLILAIVFLGLNTPHGLLIIQTMIFLKLSVSGHLTVFVARTRRRFWSRPAPAKLLLGAVIGAQVIATIIVVTRFLMTPIPWALVGVVWGWSLIWFLIEDQIKIGAFAFLDHYPKHVPVPALTVTNTEKTS